VFGTALNRFLIQAAIGHDMTVYGSGGQTRAFLNIKDTVRCVEIAAENPADQGEFRVFNQFTESFSVQELAEKTKQAAKDLDIEASIKNIENPRIENEDHYYNAVNTNLIDLGLEPYLLTQDVLKEILQEALEHKDRIIVDNVLPKVTWK
ncbi:NAD-dependent dehydratase, partial [Salinicoccus roseus]|nr:NAD-dependent dehydratase [Salinicoccus roseus]